MTAKKNKTAAEESVEAAPDFETALKRLQKIVEDMEVGDLTLESMMASFEEGRHLAVYCNRKLQDAEKKIEILLREGDRIVTKPFEPAEGDSATPI